MDTPLNEEFRESRGMLAECDGVAEVWFESEEDMIEAMSSPEGQKLGAALFEDEGRFVDHSRSSASWSESMNCRRARKRMASDRR